jgi:hypothetical protein
LSKKEIGQRRKYLIMTQPIDPHLPPTEEAVIQQESKTKQRFALVIQVASWTTPIVGLLMFGLGLFLGYSFRSGFPQNAENVPNQAVEAADQGGQNPVVQIPTPDTSAQQEALMEAVIAVTRHFKGDPNAPVTVIEFSDFL